LTPFNTVRVCSPIGNDLYRSVTVITPKLQKKRTMMKSPA